MGYRSAIAFYRILWAVALTACSPVALVPDSASVFGAHNPMWLTVRYFPPWRPAHPAIVEQYRLAADGTGERFSLLGTQVQSLSRFQHNIQKEQLTPDWLFALLALIQR